MQNYTAPQYNLIFSLEMSAYGWHGSSLVHIHQIESRKMVASAQGAGYK